MSPLRLLRKLVISTLAFGASFLPQCSPTVACAAQQQENQASGSQQRSTQQETAQPPQNAPAQPSITPPGKPAPKQRKIWRNDDVVSLRSPADTYAVEKEAKEAAAAKASAREMFLAKRIKDAGLGVELPSTAEATQALIDTKQSQVGDLQDGMDRLNKDLPGADPDQKPGMQKQIDILKADLKKVQLAIEVLQDHLQDLAKNKPSEVPSAPVTPPSPQNPL